MKRHHLIMLFLAGVVLSALIYQAKMAPKPHRDADRDVAMTADPSGVMDPVPDEAAVTQERPAPVPSPSETIENPPSAAPETDTSESLAQRIEKDFQNARQVFQQKDAIAKAKPEDLHHHPKPMLDAARQLGQIAELEVQNPEQAAKFRDFYLECARDERTLTVIRVQCLDRYAKSAKLDSGSQKQLLSEFSTDMVRLFEALQ